MFAPLDLPNRGELEKISIIKVVELHGIYNFVLRIFAYFKLQGSKVGYCETENAINT